MVAGKVCKEMNGVYYEACNIGCYNREDDGC
jgi:hypothetical protein